MVPGFMPLVLNTVTSTPPTHRMGTVASQMNAWPMAIVKNPPSE